MEQRQFQKMKLAKMILFLEPVGMKFQNLAKLQKS
nr:MAG TPA: hypothetical protein [Caudoviricetes sp.]